MSKTSFDKYLDKEFKKDPSLKRKIEMREIIFGVLFEEYLEYDDADRATDDILIKLESVK